MPTHDCDGIDDLRLTDGWKPVIEDIARRQPDLIVMEKIAYDGGEYGNEQLAQIAPILVLGQGGIVWDERQRDQGALIGRARQFDAEMARFDGVLAEVAAELADLAAELRVLFAYPWSGRVYELDTNLIGGFSRAATATIKSIRSSLLG